MSLILFVLAGYLGDASKLPDAFSYYLGDRPFYSLIAVDFLQEHIQSIDDFNPDTAKTVVNKLQGLSEAEQAHALTVLSRAIQNAQDALARAEDPDVYLRPNDKACLHKVLKESHWKTYPDESYRLKRSSYIYSGRITEMRPYFTLHHHFSINMVATVVVDQDLKNNDLDEPRTFFVIIPQGSAELGNLLFCTRAMGLNLPVPELGAGILVFSQEPQHSGAYVHVGVDGLVYEDRSGSAIMRPKYRRSGKAAISFDAYRDLTATLGLERIDLP